MFKHLSPSHLRVWLAALLPRSKRLGSFLLLGLLSAGVAYAALPTVPVPTGGGIGGAQVQDGDFLNLIGAYLKEGLTILAIVIAAAGFIVISIGMLSRWRKYTNGQIELGDLKEFFIVGAILLALMVVMATYAISTMA